MGIALPQLAPASEDRVSGVPSIDGGFRFTSTGKGHLAKIPSVCGNRQRWTWSGWIKKTATTSAQQAFMSAAENPGGSISNDYQVFYLWDNATANSYWRAQPGSANSAQTSAFFRDNAGWYHLVCVSDITQSSAVNRMKIYVNGELQSLTTNWSSAQNEDTAVNGSGYEHGLGISIQDGDKFYDGIMSQVDFIDGRVVGPEEFAFTDPLTGTWRPKRHKLTGPNDGTVWSANCTSSTPNSGTVIADFFRGSTGSCEGFQLASGGNIVLTKDILNVTNIGIYSNTGSSFTLTVNEGQGDEYTATVNSRNNVSILDEFTGFSGTLHTLKLSGFGAGTCLNGIAINGVMLIDGDTKNIGANGYYLPMDGNSPVGEDKSGITTPNNGTVWSQYLIGSGNNFYVGAQGISKAFDGKTGTYVQQQNTSNPNSMTFTPPGGISHSSKVEVWIGNTANKVSYNGGSLQTMSSGWNTVASGSGTLTTLRFERASTSGTAVRAIRIDGHQLIDGVKGNSWKPELCGSVSVDKATGALPILNTNNSGSIARPGVLGSEVSKTYTVTVASVDSANRYALDGVDRPSPTLHRGGTYTFDYTGATSHPFYLSSLPDGKHNSKAYSVEFDGTDDYLSLASSADFALGTNDWTIEYFAYPESTTQWQRHFYLIGSDANEPEGIYANSSGIAFGKATVFGEDQVPHPLNQWNHYALVHDAASMRLYINGSLAISSQNNFSDENKSLNIGYSNSTYGGYFDGKISNFRVIKGTALYTSNFTPPQTTLTNITNTKLLCCQDSDATTAAVKPGDITANGGAAATQTHQPFLYNNVHGNFGVNTSTSNVTKITVPHLAADSLYYYCSQHPNMGNTTAMSVVTDVQKADPYAWKCVYALPLIGSNQDVSNQINCTMSAAKAVASNGHAGPTSATSNFYSGSFDLDGDGDYLQTAYDDDFSFLNQDFTAECWMNTTQTSAYGTTMGRWTSSSSTAVWDLRAASADYGNRFIFITRSGSGTGYFVDSGVNVNDGLWHHLAVCRQGQYLMVFVDGTMVTIEAMYHSVNDDNSQPMRIGYGDSSNYMDGQVQDVRVYKGVAKYTESFVVGSASPDVLPDSPSGVATKSKLVTITDGSVSLNRSPSAYLTLPDHADLAPGNGDFTIETFLYARAFANYPVIWDSRESGGGDTDGFFFGMMNTGKIYLFDNSGTRIEYEFLSLRRWHHVALVRKSNVFKMYVDGVQRGSTYTRNHDFTNRLKRIGDTANSEVNTWEFDGFFSNYRFTKGQALYDGNFSVPTGPLTATSQGATGSNVKLLACQSPTSVTAATVLPTGSIGTSGSPGATTFNPFNTDINTVRGQEGNYCTWNSLYPSFGTTTFSNGNFNCSLLSTGNGTPYAVGTIAVSSGKWYWEITLTQESSDTEYIGFIDGDKTCGEWAFADLGAYFSDARKAISTTPSSYGTSYTTGDVIGVALDADNGDIEFYKNGMSQGVAASGMTGFNSYRPFTSANGTSTAQLVSANFGQKPYKFPPPDGYQPLTSSTVRSDTVTARPDKFVKTVLYTGTGSDLSLDVGFQPDFSYFACRSATGYIKYWFDSVRGATKALATSETQSSNAETTLSDGLKSFNSNGVTIGNNGQMNENSSNTWASWHWKAGGNAGTFNKDDIAYASAAAAGLTAGDVTATGSSVGTKQGFSIVSYTAAGGSTAEIPHGLEQSPNFVIIKNRDGGASGSAGGWYCTYHDNFPNKSVLAFGTFAPNSSTWNNHGKVTGTTSTVVQVADGDESTPRWWTHNDGSDYIMYSWHNVPGLQKFGTFTGNGNAAGPFIDLGFRPGIIWLKENGNAGNWVLIDGTRSQINPTANTVWMNRNLAENHTDINPDTSYNNMDILSNGFKLRSNSTGTNRTGGTYIYCAWAEAPQFNLYGTTSTAR